MSAQHLEFLVEEPSMEAFLRALLPRVIPTASTYEVHPFQGKSDLLQKLPDRLRGYAQWLPEDWRLVVVVDRDDEDCRALKEKLERAAADAQLRTPLRDRSTPWRVANRIAIEELEAWYFGDWQAVCDAYPKVSKNIPNRAKYHDPDAIRNTWEAFEGILKRSGYFTTGLRKVEAARAVGAFADPMRNRSQSFVRLRDTLVEALGERRQEGSPP